jgi:hypothetical protein
LINTNEPVALEETAGYYACVEKHGCSACKEIVPLKMFTIVVQCAKILPKAGHQVRASFCNTK